MASILAYTKARIDTLLNGKADLPTGGVEGAALVKNGTTTAWGAAPGGSGGGTATTSASDLTSGTLSNSRLADASITEAKLATQTMMTSAERTKLSNVATGATANRTDAATDALIGTKADVAGSLRVALWSGTAYQVNGVTVTSANRPANSYIEFQNGPDPASVTPSLGVINGDSWKAAS